MGSLQGGSCEWMDGHKAEELSRDTDKKEEVYHKAVEEELMSFHKRKSSR